MTGLAHRVSAGFLVSRLPTLSARNPKLHIDLAPALRFTGLDWHEADIAIRFERSKDADVIARPLTSVGYGFDGTEEACGLVKAGGDPVFIGFNEADAYLSAAKWLTKHFPRARVAFRAKDQFLQSIAARAGAGLALIPHFTGRADPLLRVCDLGAVPSNKEVFLLTRSRDRRNSSIRIVADEVVGMFEKERDLFV